MPSGGWQAIYALTGDRERALAARRVAAEVFAANGLPGEAASERLVIGRLSRSPPAVHSEAAPEVARLAGEEAARAPSAPTCRARALGLEGVIRTKGGAFAEGGRAASAPGLSLALEHELTLEAAEVYQRLGTAYEIAGDYGGARDALGTAIGLCEPARAPTASEQVCLSCMAYVLRELGEWPAGRGRSRPAADRTARRPGRHAGRRRRARSDPRLARTAACGPPAAPPAACKRRRA